MQSFNVAIQCFRSVCAIIEYLPHLHTIRTAFINSWIDQLFSAVGGNTDFNLQSKCEMEVFRARGIEPQAGDSTLNTKMISWKLKWNGNGHKKQLIIDDVADTLRHRRHDGRRGRRRKQILTRHTQLWKRGRGPKRRRQTIQNEDGDEDEDTDDYKDKAMTNMSTNTKTKAMTKTRPLMTIRRRGGQVSIWRRRLRRRSRWRHW